MVQILQPQSRQKPSFLQSIVGGLSQGASQAIPEYFQKQAQMKLMQQENEAAKQMGFDLSGISDPKMRQAIVAESLKQQGKQQIQGQKQSFLEQVFGGGSQQKNQMRMQDQQEPNEQMQPKGFDPSQITDEQIAMATSMDPALGREMRAAKDSALQQKRHLEDIDLRKSESRRKEETEISKPILLEMNQIRKNIPLQEQAILDIEEASPEVSALDYFADVTGFEPFRSAAGAKMKTAIKDFFLSDLSRAGTRPNMWIEQQLADALPKLGRSKEANLVTAAGMKFKVDLAKKRMELIDELADRDREKYGYVKADVDSRASKLMKKYVVDRQKELHDNIKKIKSDHKGKKEVVRVRSPEGSIFEISMDDIDEAKEHGYELAG